MTDICTLCEHDPATTTYGLPVCQPCADWLTELGGDLEVMELVDPELVELGERVEDSVRAWLETRDG